MTIISKRFMPAPERQSAPRQCSCEASARSSVNAPLVIRPAWFNFTVFFESANLNMWHTTTFRPHRYLQLFEIDDGLVDPSPAVVPPPDAAPNDRTIDGTSRKDQVPDMPDASPGGAEAGIISIFKIVQHETTLVKSVDLLTRWGEAAAYGRGL